MKFIIDLIEDVREHIDNNEVYLLAAGLLKEDPEDSTRLIYAGEALLNRATLNEEKRQLVFKIDGSDERVAIGVLIPLLLMGEMDVMMYGLSMDVNARYQDMEIVGFGKNDVEKRYILFIKI